MWRLVRSIFIFLTIFSFVLPIRANTSLSEVSEDVYMVKGSAAFLIGNSYGRGRHDITEFASETGVCAAINSNFYTNDNKALGVYGATYFKPNGTLSGFVNGAIVVGDISGLPSSYIIDSVSLNGGKSMALLDISGDFGQEQLNQIKNIQAAVSGGIAIRAGQKTGASTVVAPYSVIGWDASGNIGLMTFKATDTENLKTKAFQAGLRNALILDGGQSAQMYVKGANFTKNDNNLAGGGEVFAPYAEGSGRRNVPFYIGLACDNLVGDPKDVLDNSGDGIDDKPVDVPEDPVSTPVVVTPETTVDDDDTRPTREIGYDITTGWNAINFPGELVGIEDIEALLNAFRSKDISIDTVVRYEGRFDSVTMDDEGTIYGTGFNIVPQRGLLLLSKSKGNIAFEVFSDKEYQTNYSKSWNFVGIESQESAVGYLNSLTNDSIDADVITTIEYGIFSQAILKKDGEIFGNDFQIHETKGYFVRVR